MIALTFVSCLLLVIVGAQWLLAPHDARRLAQRRLRRRRTTISMAAGLQLEASLVARARDGAVGGAVGAVLSTLALWLIIRDPTGSPGLMPVAVVLSSVVLGATVAEIRRIVRSTTRPRDDVRVAGLASREPHLSRLEGLGERLLVATAALTLLVTVVAALDDVDHAVAGTICAAAAVATMAALVLARRWLLSRPLRAGDDEQSVTAELLLSASVDRFTENLIANGSVLLMYAILVMATGLGRITTQLALGLVLLVFAAAATAHFGRSRARREVAA